MQMTVREVQAAVKGRLFGEIEAEAVLETVSTDSRTDFHNGVFIAIKGERVDGHRYIDKAFAGGARLAIGEEALPAQWAAGYAYLQVENSITALQQLASAYRNKLAAPIIGISGSVGKTSTKEMIAAILGHDHPIGKTEGNLNNEIGVPLTLLSFPIDIAYGVVEMGISDFGEMELLSRIARPDICVLTNIGDCHLEALGDREGVKKAKTEMFLHMQPQGRVYLNGDDPLLAVITQVRGQKPILFGFKAHNDCIASDCHSLGLLGSTARIDYRGQSITARIPIAGVHMVLNTAVAVAIAIDFGLSNEQIEAGIAAAQTIRGRSNQIKIGGTIVIDDCYNANPMSMKASLTMLGESEGSKRIAVLGDMFELGLEEVSLHQSVGLAAASLPIETVYCIGRLAAAIADGLEKGGFGGQIITADSKEAVLEQIAAERAEGAIILVKASHGMHFDEIVDRLQQQ